MDKHLKKKKIRDINITDYNKLIFIDASGDDGFVFDKDNGNNSSNTFLVSAFITTPDKFEHNISVLNLMKQELNLPADKELKSTTLRRHRFADNAYSHVKELNGSAFSIVAFKKEMMNEKDSFHQHLVDNKQKELSGLIHSFPYYAFRKTNMIAEDEKVLLVIDHMKSIEEATIETDLKSYNDIKGQYDLIFADSNSKKFPLIQIADLISGTMRDYFENEKDSAYFKFFCPRCRLHERFCYKTPSGAKKLKALRFPPRLYKVLCLHNDAENSFINYLHFSTVPLKLTDRYFYIDCKFGH